MTDRTVIEAEGVEVVDGKTPVPPAPAPKRGPGLARIPDGKPVVRGAAGVAGRAVDEVLDTGKSILDLVERFDSPADLFWDAIGKGRRR